MTTPKDANLPSQPATESLNNASQNPPTQQSTSWAQDVEDLRRMMVEDFKEMERRGYGRR